MTMRHTSDRERILEGPIPQTLARLAWPVLVSMTMHTFFNVVNAFWVGRLGAAALAAVTTSLFATWTLWAIAEMVGVGLVAVVSRHVGAGDSAAADHAAAQGILLAAFLSFVTAATAPFVPHVLFDALGTEPEVAREGTLFLSTLFYGAASFFLLFTLEGILRAGGNTKTPMRITSVVVTLNVVLDPLLIFGTGPLPRMGVFGAAIATLAAHTTGVVLFLVHFRRHRRQFPGIPANLRRIDLPVMGRMLAIGGPTSVNTVLFSVVYLFLSREAASLGTGPLAALGVGNRVESVSYLAASALAVAAATMVGQNLGAGRPDRARRTARMAAVLAMAICSFWGVLFLVGARVILGIFSNDPAVIEPGTGFLRVIALCQPLMGIEIGLSGAFQGAGYTLLPMAISSGVSILRIPAAAVTTRVLGWGFLGIGWVITVTCLARGLLMWIVYRTYRWLGRTEQKEGSRDPA